MFGTLYHHTHTTKVKIVVDRATSSARVYLFFAFLCWDLVVVKLNFILLTNPFCLYPFFFKKKLGGAFWNHWVYKNFFFGGDVIIEQKEN
jgi:hypothetical protein